MGAKSAALRLPPPTRGVVASVGALYRADVKDPNGDAVTFRMIETAPAGISIEAATERSHPGLPVTKEVAREEVLGKRAALDVKERVTSSLPVPLFFSLSESSWAPPSPPPFEDMLHLFAATDDRRLEKMDERFVRFKQRWE